MWQLLANNMPSGVYVWNLFFASLAVSGLGMLSASLVRGHRPLVEHRLLCCVMLLLLACPLLLWRAGKAELAAISVATGSVEQPITAKSPAKTGSQGDPSSTPHELDRAPIDPPRRADAPRIVPEASVPSPARVDWLPAASRLLACVWMAGTLLVAWRWLWGLRACRRLRHSAHEETDDRVRAIAARACDAAQLDRRVAVCTARLAPGPLSLGVWRPMIVLPQGMAETLSDEELLYTLTHEAAHIARHDLAIAWLQQLCLCLYWWNPLVRAVYDGINRVREQLCDDYVVRAHGSGDTFAAVLVSLAEWCLDRPLRIRPCGVMLLQAGDDLSQRIMRLTEGGPPMTVRFTRAALATLVVVSFGMLAFAFVPVLRAENPERHEQDKVPRPGIAGTESDFTPSSKFIPTALQTKKAAPMRLSYNDGSADGKKSIAGAAEFLSFTLPDKSAKVAAIRIHGARYGYPQPPKEDFEILFLNQDLSEVIATKMAPYSRFKRGPETWIEIKFPQPVEVPEEFWIGVNFRAERTKGVYVSYDDSTDGSRSRVGLPGQEIREADVGGDWMIEVVLAK